MKRLLLLFAITFLGACGDSENAPLRHAHELRVLTHEGPTTHMADDGLGTAGFEHDLAQMFAEEAGIPLRLIVASDEADVRRRLQQDEAHLAAAWLTPDDDGSLRASRPYAESVSILVTHEASLPISDIASLNGKTVHVLADSRQAVILRELKATLPKLTVREDTSASALDLLEAVAGRRYAAVLVDRAAYDIAANFYPELIGDLELGSERPISWLFAPGTDAKLIAKVDAFLARITEDGTLDRLKDRYFGHVERLDQKDIQHFIESIRSVLPEYRGLFQEAQARSGIDWRLLAALAYQESQWNPLATSPTGVRGMMMLTTDTADRLRVSNRLNARQSIFAGARYLAELRDALPRSIREPDRLWLAIAAYNLGAGHLNGARSLAPGMNADPDSWYEMKKVLPQLSRPEIYRRLKSGKARGGEAVILVENVRIYADILARHERPSRSLDMPEAELDSDGPTLRVP
ncbi:membrane-bound lytic murein transglycosylase MltF [Rhodocyclus tenuis]|uniref:Membrane-bound lytic murein transglycosylase F n=1 Tax=Rhodocyclus tenuis TaxID=1066 RepID=A0A840GIH9_RHOTE|nr:membrane-bound lytic murein transglycosylase MltF [Rhodocyclus tenuis]MBB4247989.1 membrane-bound lytic murein transglycosylase F [Rhodocyclus tenuis]